ncbi:unnamed protein product [Rhizoctonia solani]|uniref:Protein kinase domain-containing protein n=1 Tax=Rhizoctonia solani TaxID=456999 RepID=A0A8H3DC91_9AGAM|nr:unnamed protein product [Rhizoctonia solani]
MYLYKVDPEVTNHRMRFQLLLGVIRGLAYIHTQSIVHGDLKARNVLVDGELNVARICDFGSARIECKCYSGPTEQEGTMAWDSPELWLRDETDETMDGDEEKIQPRSQKSDVWAFGCVALEVQMGTTPWDPEHKGNLIKMRNQQFKARTGHPAKESDLELGKHAILHDVWKVMKQCWRADPIQRPTAGELMNTCEMLAVNLKTA